MSASHFIVAAMIGRYSYDWDANQTQAWVGVAFIIAYMAFFGGESVIVALEAVC